MEAITTRTLIRSVAARWRGQYGDPTALGHDDRKMAAAAALDALDPETATAAEVASIIGNDSWTSIRCDECGRRVDAAVRVGEEPARDSSTAIVCRECLARALDLLDAAGLKHPAYLTPDGKLTNRPDGNRLVGGFLDGVTEGEAEGRD
jgi:hypothetical protein